MGKLSTTIVWSSLRHVYHVVTWWEVVWKTPTILRHSFICWLLLLDRLSTRDKLLKWGIPCSSLCVLCNIEDESREHIFLHCAYSVQVKRLCHFPSSLSHANWADLIEGLLHSSHGGRLSLWFKW
ncbi:hypothetical protein LINPERPRIM_LOCUS22473, partial [Linum perenne]